jgi:uncharacterized membrane protein YphA (DoxX/SURF4 family)
MRARAARRGALFVKSKASVQLQQRNYVQERPLLSSSEPIPFTRKHQADVSPRVATLHETIKLITWRVRIISLLRVICGCFCLYDIWNKWQVGFGHYYLLTLTQAAHSQIPIATLWFDGWLHIAQLNLQGFSLVVGLLEIGVGLCLITGTWTRLACGVGLMLTLVGGIGAGLLHTSSGAISFDIGVLLIFLLAFIGLLLSNAGQHFSYDRWLYLHR